MSFHEFDGEKLHPIDQTIPTRRLTDSNLEVIAHKISRIASEFSEYKADNAEAMKRMEQSMHYTHATLTESIERAADAAASAKESVKEAVTEGMAAAYPDGDPDGHRRYHEASIQKAEASAAFWLKMKEDITKYGLISFIAFAGIALWNSFLQGPHK